MSLKEKTDKNKLLKDNIKTELDKINSSIIGGGGTTANTLTDISPNITNMLKNYKKNTTLHIDQKINPSGGYIRTGIDINIDFNPTSCYLILEDKSTKRCECMIYPTHNEHNMYSGLLTGYISVITNNVVVINHMHSNDNLYCKQLILLQ